MRTDAEASGPGWSTAIAVPPEGTRIIAGCRSSIDQSR